MIDCGEAVAEVCDMQNARRRRLHQRGRAHQGRPLGEYLPTRLGGYEPPPEGGAYGELLMSSADWVDFATST